MLQAAGFLLVALLATRASSQNLFDGDACTMNDGLAGTCKPLANCTVVYNSLLAGNPPGKICGFTGFQPIVCCPLQNAPVTTKPVITETPYQLISSVVKEKCALYAREVYGLEYPPTLSGAQQLVNVSRCAIKTKTLIIGGTKADPKEFPHMVAVGFQTPTKISWDCGGSLISDRFVLTAAHCTYSGEWGSRATMVRVGDLNLERTDDEARPRDYRVVEWYRHPQYKRPSVYHDIALLKVAEQIAFDAYVRPACLPYTIPDLSPKDNRAVATGWGLVDWGDKTSSDLLKVTLRLVTHERCNSSFSDGSTLRELSRGIVDEWQVCAGEPGKDTCQGDSGGPLAVFNRDHDCMYSVFGVTSVGRACGSPDPGVYTRVVHYVPWIESVIWPEND